MNPKNHYFLATLTFLGTLLAGCASSPSDSESDSVASLDHQNKIEKKPISASLDSETAENETDSRNERTGNQSASNTVNTTKGGELTPAEIAAATTGDLPLDATSTTTLRKILANLNVQVQTLDNKINLMMQKMEDDQQGKGRSAKNGVNNRLPLTQVVTPPNSQGGSAVTFVPAIHDPEGNFVRDAAVQDFRKAMILFQGEKYSDAVLAFSDFVGEHPDHILAGSAQFYVAESYFYQREYRLAIQEFQTLLTYYKKNAHVADSLRDMALAEDHLKNPEAAARHRQLLTAVFPQSPAAAPPTVVPEAILGANSTAHPEDPANIDEAAEIDNSAHAASKEPPKVLQLKPTRVGQLDLPTVTPSDILATKPPMVSQASSPTQDTKNQPLSSVLDSPPETATINHEDFRNVTPEK